MSDQNCSYFYTSYYDALVDSMLPITLFFKEVLGKIYHQYSKSLILKWRLLDECLIHLILVFEKHAIWFKSSLTMTTSSPGFLIIQDFFLFGPSITSVIKVLQIGLETLFHSRQEKWGKYLEKCVLSAIIVIFKFLDFVQKSQDDSKKINEIYKINSLVLLELAENASFLEYIRYPCNIHIQKYSIKIILLLVQNPKTSLWKLIQPEIRNHEITLGFASSLRDGILAKFSLENKKIRYKLISGEIEQGERDAWARLIVNFLIETLSTNPNLANILMGMDMNSSTNALLKNNNCLSVMLEFINKTEIDSSLLTSEIYENCLKLVCKIAQNYISSTQGKIMKQVMKVHRCLPLLIHPLIISKNENKLSTPINYIRSKALLLKILAIGCYRLDIILDILSKLSEIADINQIIHIIFQNPNNLPNFAASSIFFALINILKLPTVPNFDMYIFADNRLRSFFTIPFNMTGAKNIINLKIFRNYYITNKKNTCYFLDNFENRILMQAKDSSTNDSLSYITEDIARYAAALNKYVESSISIELLATGFQEFISIFITRRIKSIIKFFSNEVDFSIFNRSIAKVLISTLLELLKSSNKCILERIIVARPIVSVLSLIFGQIKYLSTIGISTLTIKENHNNTLRKLLILLLYCKKLKSLKFSMYQCFISYLTYILPIWMRSKNIRILKFIKINRIFELSSEEINQIKTMELTREIFDTNSRYIVFQILEDINNETRFDFFSKNLLSFN
jgi:hypothetical protein